MKAAVIFLLLMALPPTAIMAQDKPQLSTKLVSEATAVGQPLALVIEILVPSFMPQPPVYPDLEQEGLLVRLPPRAGSPLTRTINGETWSGVSRRYQLTPLEKGRYVLPARSVLVTWRGSGTEDLHEEVALPEITFEATVPAKAADLNPPLLASGMTLEQVIEGGPDLIPGDAVTRTITARIDGVTPILLPLLQPKQENLPGLRAYPAETQVTETVERGKISGTRIEKITFVATQAGYAELPPVTLDWYDLTTQEVKTLTLPGQALTVTAPPPPPPLTPSQLAARAIVLAGMALAAAALYRFLQPRLSRRRAEARAKRQAKELYARRQVLRSLRNRDLAALHNAFWRWTNKLSARSASRANASFSELAAPLGEAQFSANPKPGDAALWVAALQQFKTLRGQLSTRKNSKKTSAMREQLNPD